MPEFHGAAAAQSRQGPLKTSNKLKAVPWTCCNRASRVRKRKRHVSPFHCHQHANGHAIRDLPNKCGALSDASAFYLDLAGKMSVKPTLFQT